VSELLALPKIKSAFASFKTAAGIFDYMQELLKYNKWTNKNFIVPEMMSIVNTIYSKIS
jgi:hypothetical protein